MPLTMAVSQPSWLLLRSVHSLGAPTILPHTKLSLRISDSASRQMSLRSSGHTTIPHLHWLGSSNNGLLILALLPILCLLLITCAWTLASLFFLLMLLTLLMLLILLIVRGHSPVIPFSFRLRFVVFFLFFVFFASLFRRHLLVLCLLRFVCLLSVLPVSCFVLLLSSSWSSLLSLRLSFVSSSLFFACLRSFVLSLHRRQISCCSPFSRMVVFGAAPSSVVFISLYMSGFRLSCFFFVVDLSFCNLCRP